MTPDQPPTTEDPANRKLENRELKYETIIFDFDSTIVSIESLDALVEIVLADKTEEERKRVSEEITRITNQGMNGEIPFDQSLSQRMALISPTHGQVIIAGKIVAEKITASFLEHKDFLIKNAKNIFIVSGGFKEMIEPTILALGLLPENIYANQFKYNKEGMAEGVYTSTPTSQQYGKFKQVEALRKSGKITGEAVIIGDGFTDLEIKNYGGADHFLAYMEHAKREKVIAGVKGEGAFRADEVISFDQILKKITKKN